MLRGVIGTAAVGAALLAAGVTTHTLTLAGGRPAPKTSSFNLQSDPSFGGTATFSATYAPMRWIAEESVACSKNGTDVYLQAQTAPSTSQPWVSTWALTSPQWAIAGGGAATCTAQLYYYTWQGKTETGVVILNTVTFTTT